VRIFRGSLPQGAGPFTKDLAYALGFAQVGQFLDEAATQSQTRRWIPLLFCGKVSLEDLPDLATLADEGLIAQPRFIPDSSPFAILRVAS
jgi:hypothetical protein